MIFHWKAEQKTVKTRGLSLKKKVATQQTSAPEAFQDSSVSQLLEAANELWQAFDQSHTSGWWQWKRVDWSISPVVREFDESLTRELSDAEGKKKIAKERSFPLGTQSTAAFAMISLIFLSLSSSVYLDSLLFRWITHWDVIFENKHSP